MRKEYDFTNSIKNPYSSKLKKQITIRIDEDTINYFRTLAGEIGIPYQKLMNLYPKAGSLWLRRIFLSH